MARREARRKISWLERRREERAESSRLIEVRRAEKLNEIAADTADED